MVTIKSNDGFTKIIKVEDWDLNKDSIYKNWKKISEESIVKLYQYKDNDWQDAGRRELQDAIELQRKSPQEYRYEFQIIGTPRIGFDKPYTLSGIELVNHMADTQRRLQGLSSINTISQSVEEIINHGVLRDDLLPTTKPKQKATIHTHIKYIKSLLSTIIKHPLWSAIIAGIVIYFLTHL